MYVCICIYIYIYICMPPIGAATLLCEPDRPARPQARSGHRFNYYILLLLLLLLLLLILNIHFNNNDNNNNDTMDPII